MKLTCLALVLGGLLVASAWADDEGLVAYYPFNEGAGAVAVDKSGSGNDGRVVGDVRWARGRYGSALELGGTDGYVDCGAGGSLDIGAAGTIAVWCRPASVRGGLVNWSTGSGWSDERLVLAVNTYGGGARLLACMADGKGFQQFRTFSELRPGEWTHLAFAFDGKSVQVYQDGLLNSSTRQAVKPEIENVPLWLGRCQGLGEECFHGLLDEVRIYSRALSAQEVFALFKQDADRRGKDVTYFHRVKVEAGAYPGPGKIIATLDARAMQPLPAGTRLRADLCKAGSSAPVSRKETRQVPAAGRQEVIFDVQEIPPGHYLLRVSAVGPDGARVGEETRTTVTWRGQPPEFRNVRILNNLVWELLNLHEPAGITGDQVFSNPCDRWIFIRSVATVGEGGKLRIALDSEPEDDAAITHSEAGTSTLEAMRYLPAGEHTVHIAGVEKARLEQLIVRSIPMLQHAFYGANPHIHPYGPYDWEFLAKDVLPNVNTMISHQPGPELEQWKRSGRKWISIIGLPKLTGANEAAVEEAYQHWSGAAGLQNPLMDGIIVDEFGGGDQPVYDVYRQAVERLYANPQFAGKAFMPYGGTFYGKDRSSEFARAAIEGGGYICWERYLPEQPDEEAARDFIRRRITDEMPRWEERFPNAARRMCVVLGYMSQPTESLNVDPSVDFKVYMDMQVRTLATHPACFGLGGIQEYHSSYADEENVRWAGRLYRHYCIEGDTEPMTGDPYKLSHLQNPDFEDGTAGWAIRPAAEGSIRAAEFSGYSWLEGRYPRTAQGDTFLLTKRSAAGPNVFSQEIKHLEAGRLYSLKMITADYQDLVGEVSREAKDAVSITLGNVEVLTGPKSSFQFTFPNCYAHHLGKFNREYRYYMNYHWRVFRAKGASARLTVSDWASEDEPGGPIGQELMYNFIEVQPYVGE